MLSTSPLHWKHWSTEKLGVTLAFLAATGFSLKAIFVKLAYAASAMDPITVLSLRMLFSVPAFVWVGFKVLQTGPALTRSDKLWLVVLGLLGYYGASILDFAGLQYISAGLERLILFTYPTLTILIGVLFLGKTLEKRHIGAIVLSYAGIGLAFAHDLTLASNVESIIIGGLFVFGSALSYALYTSGSEVLIKRIGSLKFAVLATLVSTAATQIHFAISQPWSALVQPVPVYVYCLAMALFSTVLPVFWQTAAIRHIGSARAVLIGTLGPVLTLFFGWLMLSEPISVAQMLGTALVVGGVLLVTRR